MIYLKWDAQCKRIASPVREEAIISNLHGLLRAEKYFASPGIIGHLHIVCHESMSHIWFVHFSSSSAWNIEDVQ